MKKFLRIIADIALIIAAAYVSIFIFFISFVYAAYDWRLNTALAIMLSLIIPFLLFVLLFPKKIKKKSFMILGIYAGVVLIASGINFGIIKYDESITVDTNVNINVHEYMPFVENTKIVKLPKEASLKLEDNLPVLDDAAAVFPVYSAFVNAVYPKWVEYDNEPFFYNNTVYGYKLLGEKKTDIFFGAYPSKEQIESAKQKGTEFEYTEIGREGFVFFVNKDNPVENLTIEQVKDIYSGKITNWKDVGGKDEEIVAFQRNEGSGSQSMLKRVMGDVPLMDPPSENVNDLMSGIIEVVSDYRNHSNSIGFSFRYYLEGIIANPNVKMLKINGVAPTAENISSGAYEITTSLYAVTYKGNENENVNRLIDWILSEEGQAIVEKTGYARAK